MHLVDRLKIYLFHKERIRRWNGTNHKVQGWSSHEEQQVRFETFARNMKFKGKRVLDLGCGLGELYDYLSENQRPGFYLGFDQHWSFLHQARKRIGSSQCRFKFADISRATLPEMDIIVASGSLNYQTKNPDYLNEMIMRMFSACKEATIFNLLNIESFPDQQVLQAYNKLEVLQFCQTVTPNVTLIDDYSDADFTLVLRK